MRQNVFCKMCPDAHFDHIECGECGLNLGMSGEPTWKFCPQCGTSLSEPVQEEAEASCGHLERWWKVEVNQDAWCVMCALAADRARIERLEAALREILTPYMTAELAYPQLAVARMTKIAAAALEPQS